MPQPQPIPVNEVRNDEYQRRYEGDGEEAPWNEDQRNQPRGQMGYRGRGGRCGPVPHRGRQYGNQHQGGEPREAYANQGYGQEAREEHGNQHQGENQRRYYNHDQGGNGGRDVGINSIKTTIPSFKGECNPDAYLEWESQCDRIFNVSDLTEEYMKKYHLVIQEGHPPPWTELKRLMTVKYVPERYRQGLLAKLYNLRQGSKNVEAYHNEFQNMAMKLDYEDIEKHVVIHFKVGLNNEISSKMTIHRFATVNEVFEASHEIESKNKGGAQASSGWNKDKDLNKPYEKKPFEGNTPKYPQR
ncbi:hypothetical protein KY284_010788 [Solanum tuberosum]|nr:hypothetical protein KY284_010788 [Solanum tuberosum]